MDRRAPSALLVLALLALVVPAALAIDPALEEVVEGYYEEFLRLNPILATFNGDPRYDDQFRVGLSAEERAEALAVEKEYLARIEALDPATLHGQDLLSWEIFRRNRLEQIEAAQHPDHLIPISQFFSVPNFFVQLGSGPGIQPMGTVAEHEAWLKRASGFPAWVDQAILNLREGVEKGIVQPRVLIERTLPQLASQVVDDPTQSLLYRPTQFLPDDIPDADRGRLTAAYATLVGEELIPAFARLHDYLEEEYLPHTRDTVGLTALPGGDAWYAHLVRTHTHTDWTPRQIHEKGLAEVARIEARMAELRGQIDEEPPGFSSEEEMLQVYRDFKDVVKARIPQAFHEWPDADFEVRAVEPYRQASAAGAFYQAASPDGSRPGVFYVNTGNWEERTRQGTETLYLHEAVPGHHYQISIARELGELPRFRRFGGYTAYSEGWALYVETIGQEYGMFSEPYYELGQLGSELFRAKRLVVDTGLHTMGWSREKAIDYLGSQSEVERYIAMPGQALAYKMGQLKIAQLREMAEDRLGDRFDVRDFHSEILRDGALPMDVLDAKVRRWVEGVAAGM